MKTALAEKLFSWEEKHGFRPKWYSLFVNPYFIARWHLKRQITAFANQHGVGKKILDVGCGNKPYEKLFPKAASFFGIDIAGGGHSNSQKKADKFFDGVHIPYAAQEFDIVLLTQVLEHATEPHELLKEINRVLEPNGMLFLTMPFVWDEHEVPYDFRRYTSFEHRRLLEQNHFSVLSLRPTTGAFGTTGQLISAFLSERFAQLVEKLPIKFRFKYPLNKLFIFLVCAPLQIMALLLDAIFQKKGITLDYVATAKKTS